jgi:hypothetical protein
MYREFIDEDGFSRSICYDDGWKHLVQPLLDELEQLGGKVLQVKEKFGGLRFYYTLAETHPMALVFAQKVDKAEAQSFETCEACGQPGERRGGGWIKTLCEHDHQKRQAKEQNNEHPHFVL